MMIDQSVIDEEMVFLRSAARLLDLGELQWAVSSREEGALIFPIRLGDTPVTWNNLPPGTEEREVSPEGLKINTRIACALPHFITLILPDGEVVRGMDGDHELWEALTIAIEMHYIAGVTDQYNKWIVGQLDEALAAAAARHAPGFSAN